MQTSPIAFPSKLRLVGVITLVWVIIGIIQSFYDAVIQDPATQEIIFYINPNHTLLEHVLLSMIGPLLGGMVGGPFIVFSLARIFRRRSFGRALLVSSIIILVIIMTLVVLVNWLFQISILNKPFYDPGVLQRLSDVLFSYAFFKFTLSWFVINILTVIALQINDQFGPGVLWNLIRGKYHHPRKEQRIFMFLDMKSSTTIAEKLGHEKFFDLLNRFFDDLTDPIIYSKGEVYQYVGDQVVVSWKVSNGLQHQNCVRCFFEGETSIQGNSERYIREFELVPEFKAAVHIGEVTTGEIGVIKKDIVFSGDVLNTTARIQGLCKGALRPYAKSESSRTSSSRIISMTYFLAPSCPHKRKQ